MCGITSPSLGSDKPLVIISSLMCAVRRMWNQSNRRYGSTVQFWFSLGFFVAFFLMWFQCFHLFSLWCLSFLASTTKTVKQQRAKIHSVFIFAWWEHSRFISRIYSRNNHKLARNSEETLGEMNPYFPTQLTASSGCNLRIPWHPQQSHTIGCFIKADSPT